MRIGRIAAVSLLGLVLLGSTSPVWAGSISGTLYYTRFSGAPNVKSVSFSYDGLGTFALGAPATIGTTAGADGIAGNPQDPDLLLVGAQGGAINTISKTTGTPTAYPSPVAVFHLDVADATTVYGSGIPGFLARHTINPDGSLTAGTLIALSGADTTITQLITTPGGYFYTSSGPGGFGSYGMLTFTGAASATTTRFYGTGGILGPAFLAAAHGGTYDPFTGSVIIMGSTHVTQLSLAGAILSDSTYAGNSFDQGTVSGSGHLFAADNGGDLLFVDYGASGLVGAPTFTSIGFLDSNLDDVAPLVGAGSTASSVPLPSAAFIGLAMFGTMAALRRLRQIRRT
jgi:hypothetical protein